MPLDQELLDTTIEDLKALNQFQKGSFTFAALVQMALIIMYASTGEGGGGGDGITAAQVTTAINNAEPIDVAGPLTDSQLRAESIVVTPQKAVNVNTPAIITTAGDILAARPERIWFSVQNTGTSPAFLLLLTGASATVHHAILPGGTAQDDGTGGYFSMEGHPGVVSIAGTDIRCVVTERWTA